MRGSTKPRRRREVPMMRGQESSFIAEEPGALWAAQG
jgi:hypothetical protein